MNATIDSNKDNVFPEHPGPKADTSTPYDDEDDEENHLEQQEKVVTIDLENYFEIILMTSPVAGIKYYMPKHEPTQQHALIIQKPKQEAAP